MKSLNLKTGGKIAVAAGIVASIFLLTFILFLATRNFLWGALGDLINTAGSVLLIPLFVVMGRMTVANHRNPGRLVLILGVLAALLKLAGRASS